MDTQQLDIESNRAAVKYPPDIQMKRIAWAAGRVLFRLTPRPLYALRCQLLRLFGARIGRRVHISNTAVIFFPWNLEIGDWSAIGDHVILYNLGKMNIGCRATVSQYAHLCAGTHDYLDPAMPLRTPPVSIGDMAWICADAFVGPGVHVGEGAVVGARAVVTRDVDSWDVVVGNPAAAIRKRVLQTGEGK